MGMWLNITLKCVLQTVAKIEPQHRSYRNNTMFISILSIEATCCLVFQ